MVALPDIVVLHRTLLADGGLPSGYEKEFSAPGPVLETAAQHRDRRLRELSNMEASILLKQYKAQEEKRAKDAKTSADQFPLPAEMQPRRYMSRLQRGLYAGAGRRASTLRSRVRALRRYLNWLALNHDTGYPSELEHVTGYLQAPQSEHCTRNALRGAHATIVFMEEVAEVEQSTKFTSTQVYAIIQKESLANTLPCRLSKQAPRILIGMLSMLEELIMNEGSLVHQRIHAWWIIVQSWGTLRFDDHARLTRSKTLGSDRSVSSRQIYINACCCLGRKDWLEKS